MPRHDTYDDDDDLPDGVYHDDDDDMPTVQCPYCSNEIAEDAQYCPRCENYLSKVDHPREAKSWFWIVMMVLAFLAAAAWALGH